MVYTRSVDVNPEYAELQTTTNFSFLRGASHPHEYIWRAKQLGYYALGIADFNTLAGVIRAHVAAREAGIKLCVGARLEVDFQGSLNQPLEDRGDPYHHTSLILYPIDLKGYQVLSSLITRAKSRVSKNDFQISLAEVLAVQRHFAITIVPPFWQTRLHLTVKANTINTTNARLSTLFNVAQILKENSAPSAPLSLAVCANYSPSSKVYLNATFDTARALSIPTIATNDVYYHTPERKALQDTVTAIRLGSTLAHARAALFPNSERYLKSPHEMARLFAAHPEALRRTIEIADIASSFSLSELRYRYPKEVTPIGRSPAEYLRELAFKGASERYPYGVPEGVVRALNEELSLIRELDYERYFLTCYDIVAFAKRRGILCQGRGAAANSVVCFCLGITAVNPQEIDLLFARFISKERQEPPDIDIDFEHERREEVIQYIYSRYGRERAALTAEVVTFQPRSAIREVGKALGLPLETINTLSKEIHRWTDNTLSVETLRGLGLNPFDQTIQNTLALARQLIGAPRHLSQHVGGFIICDDPLSEIVPIINAGMENRTIIEWDKNDIEELGMLKIDILALGMLTCIRKALALVNSRRHRHKQPPLELYGVPANDTAVYDMLCRSDTVGVFQVESRAQMAMLPRLKPRCFYDLVIEVALVRPGPIQGNMVHPFLRRRSGLEKVSFPDARVEKILGKTLGVPIFQEQAMRLAITLANFSPGEAEKLRRAMAAWKSHRGVIATFKEKIIRGMISNGYSIHFAESCLNQIQGFSEYGFPESHAASFALLVYASAWLKHHYPAEFACALLNSQPMGFYAPAQIIQDAQRHGVKVAPIDANHSDWECRVDYDRDSAAVLRLGLKLVRGLSSAYAHEIVAERERAGGYSSVHEVWARAKAPPKGVLNTIAHADAFASLGLSRSQAHWEIEGLPRAPGALDLALGKPGYSVSSIKESEMLPKGSRQGELFKDYAATGFSLRGHPYQYIRQGIAPSIRERLRFAGKLLVDGAIALSAGTIYIGGLVITRQRPSTAKGVVFITLEDETGTVNLIIRPKIFERYKREVMLAETLIARGRLERIGEVAYLDVVEINPV